MTTLNFIVVLKMKRVKLTSPKAPPLPQSWLMKILRPNTIDNSSRGGTTECPLNRRVARIDLEANFPYPLDYLEEAMGKKRRDLCKLYSYPYPGRAQDGTWCCYGTSKKALEADPNWKYHKQDMKERSEEHLEATKMKVQNDKNQAESNCSPNMKFKICKDKDDQKCCEGFGYPCYNEESQMCYRQEEEVESNMKVLSRGIKKIQRQNSNNDVSRKKRRTTNRVTFDL
jgi:hypothetical protein